MYCFIPRHARVTGSGRKETNLLTGRSSYRAFAYDSGDFIDYEDFFANSHGQKVNTIVHSKLTGIKDMRISNAEGVDAMGVHSGNPGLAWYATPKYTWLVRIEAHALGYTSMWKPITGRTHRVRVWRYHVNSNRLIEEFWVGFDFTSEVGPKQSYMVWPNGHPVTLAPSTQAVVDFICQHDPLVAVDNDTYGLSVILPLAKSLASGSLELPLMSNGAISSNAIGLKAHPPVDPKNALLFNEYERLFEPDIFFPSGDKYQYEWNLGRYQAYLSACENIPRFSDNMIANIIEWSSAIYKLLFKHQVDLPSTASEAWLAYRYSYSTTKLDLEQMFSYCKRIASLPNFYSVYGVYHGEVDGVPITHRCTFRLENPIITGFRTLCDKMYNYGIEPNLYVLWDLIPFSFVVDWFVPIGDLLSNTRLVTWASTMNIHDICYSIAYNRTIDGNLYDCYTRYPSGPPRALESFIFQGASSPSGKTQFKRVIDGLSLFLA